MKKLTKLDVKNFFKTLNYRHYICWAITVSFVLMSAFLFPYAIPRLIEAFRDFGLSIAYYFTELFGFENVITPSVTSYSKMPFTISDRIPLTWEEFKIKWGLYWQAFADSSNFFAYLDSSKIGLKIFANIVTLIVPIFLIVYLAINSTLNRKNIRYNEDTKPLQVFKNLSTKIYRPAKKFVKEFVAFVKDFGVYLPQTRKPKKGDIIERQAVGYVELWALIWLLNFNIITIAVEALAYYFYFVMSFDLLNIYQQVYKLLLDLSVMWKFIPLPGWIIIGTWIFDKIRKKIGDDILWHHELMNRGFINERGVFVLITAPMRGGKNKLEVSFTLSKEVMFIDMAYEIILNCDLKFPFFPWINFENSIRTAMRKGLVFNLATCRLFVSDKMKKFYKRHTVRNLWDYDYERYGLEYDNGKYIETLEEVLTNYAQAYLIYVEESSLILSNYSIRVDNLIKTLGNFPLRNTDFFKRDSRLVESQSRHSHILNFDVLRLGKKVAKESGFAFEFGIIDITEIGKERLNMLESQGIDKADENANQKNDGFDSWVKMCGHNATVDHKCFVAIYADEQRSQNLPASLREVGEIIQIDENDKDKLAMPFFYIEELIHAFFRKKFEKLHKNIRYNRGDNSLLYYIIHTVVSKFENYYDKIYGTYGYEEMKILIQDGLQEKDKKKHRYFISYKKDLSKRYSTDCLSDILAVRALRAMWGLSKEPVYAGDKAKTPELQQTNSYFINNAIETVSNEQNTETKTVSKKNASTSPKQKTTWTSAKKLQNIDIEELKKRFDNR